MRTFYAVFVARGIRYGAAVKEGATIWIQERRPSDKGQEEGQTLGRLLHPVKPFLHTPEEVQMWEGFYNRCCRAWNACCLAADLTGLTPRHHVADLVEGCMQLSEWRLAGLLRTSFLLPDGKAEGEGGKTPPLLPPF